MPAQRRHLPISLPRQRLAAGLGACLALLIVALLWWRPWVAAGCPPDSGAELLGDASDPATTAGPIRIMPLGDSLTDGFDVPGGYRIELWSLLAGDGLCVDFVGSLTNGPRTMPDRDHEGHSGWRIDQIAGSAGPWLERHRPQIVLLLVGTNDVVQDFALAAAPGRLGALIDQITGALPESRVVVASIPRV